MALRAQRATLNTVTGSLLGLYGRRRLVMLTLFLLHCPTHTHTHAFVPLILVRTFIDITSSLAPNPRTLTITNN